MLVPDLSGTGSPNLAFTPELARVDLQETSPISIEFAQVEKDGYEVRGQVRGEGGLFLPFAWVSVEGMAKAQQVQLESGEFTMSVVPAGLKAFTINSPGYYSRVYRLDPSTEGSQALSVLMVPQPDARFIPWGNGAIVAPSGSLLEMDGQKIRFQQGWLWGDNQDTEAVSIQHDLVEVQLIRGRFAIESLPNSMDWFYLFDGKASLLPTNGLPAVQVTAGEMVALMPDAPPVPVPLDQTVISALHPGVGGYPEPVWEPTLRARIRDTLARIGIGGVQLITFITFGLILISIVVFPIMALYLKLIRPLRIVAEENNERI
jgi:hypothetical protein